MHFFKKTPVLELWVWELCQDQNKVFEALLFPSTWDPIGCISIGLYATRQMSTVKLSYGDAYLSKSLEALIDNNFVCYFLLFLLYIWLSLFYTVLFLCTGTLNGSEQ